MELRPRAARPAKLWTQLSIVREARACHPGAFSWRSPACRDGDSRFRPQGSCLGSARTIDGEKLTMVDIDIDRDCNITRGELTRYMDTTFR